MAVTNGVKTMCIFTTYPIPPIPINIVPAVPILTRDLAGSLQRSVLNVHNYANPTYTAELPKVATAAPVYPYMGMRR
jgi:hypothetical protein